jgi:hypothetical protein
MSGPPPTVSGDDGFAHRRQTDYGGARSHRRWYDSTKVQISLILVIVGSWAGAVGIGFSMRDMVRAVQGIPMSEAAQAAINESLQRQITTNTRDIMALDRRLSDMSVVIWEIHCILLATTPAQVQECQSEETRRRMRAIQPGRN